MRQNFFHSIFPVEHRSMLHPKYLKELFLMLIQHVNVKTTGGYRIVTVADKAMNVRADVDFCTKMEKVVGRGNVKLMRN